MKRAHPGFSGASPGGNQEGLKEEKQGQLAMAVIDPDEPTRKHARHPGPAAANLAGTRP
jgi:hypothetical protein